MCWPANGHLRREFPSGCFCRFDRVAGFDAWFAQICDLRLIEMREGSVKSLLGKIHLLTGMHHKARELPVADLAIEKPGLEAGFCLLSSKPIRNARLNILRRPVPG